MRWGGLGFWGPWPWLCAIPPFITTKLNDLNLALAKSSSGRLWWHEGGGVKLREKMKHIPPNAKYFWKAYNISITFICTIWGLFLKKCGRYFRYCLKFLRSSALGGNVFWRLITCSLLKSQLLHWYISWPSSWTKVVSLDLLSCLLRLDIFSIAPFACHGDFVLGKIKME